MCEWQAGRQCDRTHSRRHARAHPVITDLVITDAAPIAGVAAAGDATDAAGWDASTFFAYKLKQVSNKISYLTEY